MLRRKICVLTGSRAEYGLLRPLMVLIRDSKEMELQVVVTGMHLSAEFGSTWKRIEEDGFAIARKVEMLLSSDSAVGVSKSMGLGQIGFADAFEELAPDLLIVLGDRFEILPAVAAAAIACIPVAHLHGGERSEGAVDEQIRHAVTKLSHLHFTSTEEYRRRVIQMGEPPDRVFNVGAIGLDNIKDLAPTPRALLEQDLGFALGARNLLVTFHPATLSGAPPEEQFRALTEALDRFADAHLIFTKANADAGGRILNQLTETYVASRPGKAVLFSSLGQQRYLSLMGLVDAVVGNSSSGIIEAPSFRIPTVNIGDRQKGRVRAASVIDCLPESDSISAAIGKALSAPFRAGLASMANPYGSGNTAPAIARILAFAPWDGLIRKAFHDLP